ncbi:MAG: AbiV family abortive infection protein [Candidatus Aquicultorales bacterium]
MAVKKGFVENVTDDQVRDMLGLIPRNVFRLLQDAILLYNHASFSSAFALAIYALEEIGKAFVFIAVLNPDEKNTRAERLSLLNKAFSDHTSKQREALQFMGDAIEEIKSAEGFNTLLWGISNKYDDVKLSTIYDRIAHTFRKVELRKRRSIYIDLDGKGRPTVPSVRKAEAFDTIDTCIDALAILTLLAQNVTKNAWLARLLRDSAEELCPGLEEVIELGRLIYYKELEALVRESPVLPPDRSLP